MLKRATFLRIDRRPGQSDKGEGGAGTQPGVDYIETEIEIEELIEMMLQDLGLPNLTEKTQQELEILLGFKIKGVARQGPRVLLDRKLTSREAFRRFCAYVEFLKGETGRSEEECANAIYRTQGVLEEALTLLKTVTSPSPKKKEKGCLSSLNRMISASIGSRRRRKPNRTLSFSPCGIFPARWAPRRSISQERSSSG